jgi:hypothetical protein
MVEGGFTEVVPVTIGFARLVPIGPAMDEQ